MNGGKVCTFDSMLRYRLLTTEAFPPTRATAQSVGFDLKSAYDYVIAPESSCKVETDIAIVLPKDCFGHICGRSGLGLHHKISILGGVIDPDYTGSISAILYNAGKTSFAVHRGDKVAQLICQLVKIPLVSELPADFEMKTERGDKGFGSSGV